jgi:hypothetical protein
VIWQGPLYRRKSTWYQVSDLADLPGKELHKIRHFIAFDNLLGIK